MADEKATVEYVAERGRRLLAWELAYDGDAPSPDDLDWLACELGAPIPRDAANIAKALASAYSAGQQTLLQGEAWREATEADLAAAGFARTEPDAREAAWQKQLSSDRPVMLGELVAALQTIGLTWESMRELAKELQR